MPGPGGKEFNQSYNCQAAVDSAHQVIVAADVINQPSDKAQALPLVQQIERNTGSLPKEASADAGYYSAQAVEELYALGVDPFIPPDKTRHGAVLPPAPRGRIPSQLSPGNRMRRKLRTQRGKQRYALQDGDGGAGVRANQTGPGLPAVSAARVREGPAGVAADLCRTQPAQALLRPKANPPQERESGGGVRTLSLTPAEQEPWLQQEFAPHGILQPQSVNTQTGC